MTCYAMAIDLKYCIGCYNCQIACKDEHVGNDYPPIAKSQPMFGHFWMSIQERERVLSPTHIKVEYIPTPCQHCDDPPCQKAAAGGAIYKRPDGIVIINPEKAKGQKQVVDACPYGAIYWNEEAGIPQKCTFCAHLLDDGWKEPRCVQSCPVSCMYFGDIDDPSSKISKFLAANEAGYWKPETGAKPMVRYVGLPRPTLRGAVIFGDKGESAKGAAVTITGPGGTKQTATDFFGDFIFDGLALGKYTLKVEAPGYAPQTVSVDMSKEEVYCGEVSLKKAN